MGHEASAASVLGANFSAGFVAGSLAAAATCPLDVARTRRQIEVSSEDRAFYQKPVNLSLCAWFTTKISVYVSEGSWKSTADDNKKHFDGNMAVSALTCSWHSLLNQFYDDLVLRFIRGFII